MRNKLFGQGYELSIFQLGADFVLSMPVDSGFVSRSFDFVVDDRNLDVLRFSKLRRKVLEFILHERLQWRMDLGDYQNVEEEVRTVIEVVLYGNEDDLARQISMAPNPDRIRYRMYEANLKLGWTSAPYAGQTATPVRHRISARRS